MIGLNNESWSAPYPGSETRKPGEEEDSSLVGALLGLGLGCVAIKFVAGAAVAHAAGRAIAHSAGAKVLAAGTSPLIPP